MSLDVVRCLHFEIISPIVRDELFFWFSLTVKP